MNKVTLCGSLDGNSVQAGFQKNQPYDIRVETCSPTANLEVWETAWG